MINTFDSVIFYLFVTSAVMIALALIKTNRSQYIFSLAIICLGLGTLYYSYFTPKPKVEDYNIEQIHFTECWYDENINSLVLKTETNTYQISNELIEKVTTIANASSIFSKNSEAKVWVRDLKYSNKLVRGLETKELALPISYGIELDNPSDFSLIGWLVFILGLLLYILTRIFGSLRFLLYI